MPLYMLNPFNPFADEEDFDGQGCSVESLASPAVDKVYCQH